MVSWFALHTFTRVAIVDRRRILWVWDRLRLGRGGGGWLYMVDRSAGGHQAKVVKLGVSPTSEDLGEVDGTASERQLLVSDVVEDTFLVPDAKPHTLTLQTHARSGALYNSIWDILHPIVLCKSTNILDN